MPFSRHVQIAIEIALARLYERGRRGVSTSEIAEEILAFSPDIKWRQVNRSIARMGTDHDGFDLVWEANGQENGSDEWYIDERYPKLLRIAYPERFKDVG